MTYIIIILTSLVAQMVKRLPTMWETWVRSLGQEDPLEKEMATHSSILAWRIPWTEEPGGCSLWGRKKSDTSERLHFTSLLLHHYTSTILLSVYKENSKGLLFATDTYSYLSLTHTHPDTHTHTHTHTHTLCCRVFLSLQTYFSQ